MKSDWEEIAAPTAEGWYHIQWFRPDGSTDGPTEIQHVDPDEPGWAANAGGYAWTPVAARVYPASRAGASGDTTARRTAALRSAVAANPEVPQRALADRLGIDKSAVSRIRRELRNEGL